MLRKYFVYIFWDSLHWGEGGKNVIWGMGLAGNVRIPSYGGWGGLKLLIKPSFDIWTSLVDFFFTLFLYMLNLKQGSCLLGLGRFYIIWCWPFQRCSSPRAPSPICALLSGTPVRKRFSPTQEGLGRVIPGGEGPGDGTNEYIEARSIFLPFVFHLWSAQRAAVALDLSRSFSSYSEAGTKGCLDLSSRCWVVDVNRSRSWRRCSGFNAWQGSCEY